MKFLVIFLIQICVLNEAFAQANKQRGKSGKPIEITLADSSIKDYDPNLLHIDHQPIPSAEYGNKKEELNKKRALKKNEVRATQSKEVRSLAAEPTIVKTFRGNIVNSVPDNDIAVSNDLQVLSVVNSNVRVYDDTGKSLYNRSLSAFFSPLGLTGFSDPRVLYDPKADRFIMVCFVTALSTTSKILVAFSKTNDPKGAWNLYTLNGNSFNDSTWSDYPIIAITDKDLFMTFNQVKDNISWTVGFKQSVIWQIDKEKGYAGDSLVYDLWSDIKMFGTNLRNICPAKYQSTNMGDNMYFLTLRNVADENDSLFVTEITNSLSSGKAELKQRLLKMPIKYGFPPNAIQKKSSLSPTQGNYLMTNDARVLAAIYENDYLHFGSNTINTDYTNAAVCLSTIKNISADTPKVEAKIFSTAEREYGYPSMTYMGSSQTDHRVLFTFSHCITDSFPGTSIVYKDAYGNFSNIVATKEGINSVDQYTDSTERWGDYTNIQKLYNNPDKAYLAGTCGAGSYQTWISVIENKDSLAPPPLPIADIKQENAVFPNPIEQNFYYLFDVTKEEPITFELYNMQGQRVAELLKTTPKLGKNKFSFSTKPLPTGIYIFRMTTKDKQLASQRVIAK